MRYRTARMATTSLPDPVDFSAGEVRLGPYRLLRPISAGGMARVYEGRLDSLAGVTTRVAVKVIHPDYASEAAFQELFITEARISARLEHQNLVRIQQFNREGHLYYLVMEYIDGVTLRKVITLARRRAIELPVQVIAELGRQVCEGLSYAHNLLDENGAPLRLVHRDIKPSNLMLNAHGVTKVLDFGISSAGEIADPSGGVKGTWGYMGLEQAEGGAVGPASDVFGLGAVLYELAALEPLFTEKDNGVIRQRLHEDMAAARAAALGGTYANLGGVLVRALQRDPAARYGSAAAFGRALAGLVLDPVGVHEQLLRLYRDLRAEDGAPVTVGQEKPRSMTTMSRAGVGSPRIDAPPTLPVRFGDAHGVGPSARQAPRPQARVHATIAAALLLCIAVAVLGFATWQLFFGSPRRPEPAHEEVARVVAPEPSVGVVPTPAPPAPPAPIVGTPAPVPEVAEPDVLSKRPTGTPKRPAPSTPTEPDAPVRIAPSTTVVAAPPEPVAEPEPVRAEVRTTTGVLTVSSMPRAQVMIDGQYVRYTPIFQHTIGAGTHSVLLVAEDGRRKSFKVEVAGNEETRRIWLFDEERWSEQ